MRFWSGEAAAILVVAAATASGAAWACDCERRSFDEDFERSAQVFLGRVASISGEDVAFTVSAWWKGSGRKGVLKQGQGADCRYLFQTGRDYLVFARNEKDGALNGGSHCGFTRPAEEACDVLAGLGLPLRPGNRAVAAIGFGTVLLTLVLARFRRTRRAAYGAAVAGAVLVSAVWLGQGPASHPYGAGGPDPTSAASAAPLGVELQMIGRPGERLGGPVVFVAGGSEIVALGYESRTLCRLALDGGTTLNCAAKSDRAGRLAINAAGTQLVLADNKGLQLFSLPSIVEVAAVKTSGANSAETVQFSPDGQRIVAADWGEVVVIDLASQKLVRTLSHPEARGNAAAISGDGRRAAVSWSERGADDRWRVTLHVFSVDDGRELAKLSRDCGGWGRNLSFDAEGRTLAWAEPGGIQIYDVDSQTLLSEFVTGAEGRWPLVSPDGRRVAVGGSGGGVWDARSGKQVLQFPSEAGIWPEAFSADGHRLAATTDQAIRILDVAPR